jgi:hypothetical protein
MSKKVYTLVSSILGGCATIATAIVAYISPEYMVPIIGSIGIGVTAVNEIMLRFVKS